MRSGMRKLRRRLLMLFASPGVVATASTNATCDRDDVQVVVVVKATMVIGKRPGSLANTLTWTDS
jgi:hypothetical protein